MHHGLGGHLVTWSTGRLVSVNIPYCLTCDWQDCNVNNNQHKENQSYQTWPISGGLMKGMPEKTTAFFFSIVVAKTGQIDLDTFLKVKKLARASGGGALPERKGVFLGFLPLIHKLLCFISFQLWTTMTLRAKHRWQPWVRQLVVHHAHNVKEFDVLDAHCTHWSGKIGGRSSGFGPARVVGWIAFYNSWTSRSHI